MVLFLGAAVATSACGAPPSNVQSVDRKTAALAMGKNVTDEQRPINQRFRTLDDYLAYLELQSHNDGKWYKEVRPGVYEVQTGNLHLLTDAQQRIFTRQELEKQFGFAR
jgi:hypothetical protein